MNGRAPSQFHRSEQRGSRIYGILATVLFVAGLSAVHSALFQQPGSKMQLTSTAFDEGKPIPVQYTCEGTNVSPPLQWTGAPAQTKSFVLIVDDPDAPAGTWVHWVLYDLPANVTTLAEHVPKSQPVSGDGKQGLNDFKQSGYGGPCPPPGKPHRYLFKLYALDTMLGLKPGVTKKAVESAMAKHVVGQAQLMGRYERKK